MEAHLQKEKTSHSIQDTEGGWCILHHLLGCCFLAQAHRGLHGLPKERKVTEAVRCFFRYSMFYKFLTVTFRVQVTLEGYSMCILLHNVFICT